MACCCCCLSTLQLFLPIDASTRTSAGGCTAHARPHAQTAVRAAAAERCAESVHTQQRLNSPLQGWMRLPAGGTAKFSSPHRASSSTHSGGPPSQRGVPQLASRRAGARQLSPCRHRAGRTAAGVRRTTPQVAAAAAAEQQDARALAHAVAGMALEAEVATAAQEPPYQTECVRVDPASFAWPSAATAAAPPPDGDGNGDALQQLAHIQHDLDFRSTPPHAAANGAHTAGAAADNDDVAKLQRAAALIRQGHTVAMPTETVYGLAASALDAAAVRRIYAAKRRPADNPLIVHVSSLDMLHALYPPGWQLPPQYAEVVARHWPGPLTILLPRSDKVRTLSLSAFLRPAIEARTALRVVPSTCVLRCERRASVGERGVRGAAQVPGEVVCGQATMAVRLPAHPVARALIALAGVPLAAPSANSSGRPSPTLAQHVVQDLGGRVPLVIDGGPCHSGVESTVSRRLLPGCSAAWTKERARLVLGDTKQALRVSVACRCWTGCGARRRCSDPAASRWSSSRAAPPCRACRCALAPPGHPPGWRARRCVALTPPSPVPVPHAGVPQGLCGPGA